MRKTLVVAAVALFLACVLAPRSQATMYRHNKLLSVCARNDKPGAVNIEVRGLDHRGNEILNDVMTWDLNDNSFSIEELEIPGCTRVLRFTFINDQNGSGADLDRNAYIDYFRIGRERFEGENFDWTGGPDANFPGCAPIVIKDSVAGARFAADCGNEGDYIEFALPPGVGCRWTRR